VSPPEVVQFPFAVYSVQFTPDDRELLVGTWGTGLSFIDRATGVISPGPHMDHPFVTRAITLPDHRIAATAQPGTFQVFDMKNNGAAQSYRAGDKTIWQISASADGKLIAGGGEGGIVTVWSQTDGVQRIFKHKGIIHAVAMTPDGTHVVTGCADQTVRVFDIAQDKEVRALNNVSASDIVVLSDNHRILIGSADYQAYLWDYSAENSLEKYSGHTSTVTTVAVSPDERWIVTGSDDNTVRVWNLATKEQAKRYTGHTQNVTRVCVAPDGLQLASASKDQTVRLWDMPRSEASPSKLETPPAASPGHEPEATDEAFRKQEPKPVIDPQSAD
jgi:WD40 repeat protein